MRFPVIDERCPLGQDELASIAGHCGRCGETVHLLDHKDDAARLAFMSQAKGPVCVSYRLPMRIAAALAISLAAPALAQDGATSETPLREPGAFCATEAAPPLVQAEEEEELVVTVGTVREPWNAQWTEDMSLPELPTASDDSEPGK